MSFMKIKKRVEESVDSPYMWMTLDEALGYNKIEGSKPKVSNGDITSMTQEICDRLKELNDRQTEDKLEFSAVTGYLSDIQKLERMDEKSHMAVDDAARMVMNLDFERENFQQKGRTLSNERYKTMSIYETELPIKIDEIAKKEEYMLMIKEDLRKLEGEKGSLKYAQENAKDKKMFLNKLSYAIMFIAIGIFIALFMLNSRTGKNFTLPFFTTGVAVLGYIAYYIVNIRNCNIASRNSEILLGRATILINKTKIKYVNTRNVLDFMYEKYHVNSLYELQSTWEEYVHVKEAEKRYRKNTQLLNAYRDNLADALKRIGINRPDLWIHQPDTLLDRSEMMDFKDGVENRYRKLKGQIEFTGKQIRNANTEIETLRSKYSEYDDTINKVLSRNMIEIK